VWTASGKGGIGKLKRTWLDFEVEYLEKWWGNSPISKITKRLKRTESSVIQKAFRLGLGDSRLNGDGMSVNQFSKATGICSYTIIERWIKKFGFPVKVIKMGRFPTRIINLKTFWKWAEDNKSVINFAKWEKGALGAEPEWVDEKRRADSMNPSKTNYNRKWTKHDDALLIQKTKSCKYTYADLSHDFCRTEQAIKRRLQDLNVSYRPVPLDTHVKWTTEEKETLKELHSKGFDSTAISRMMGKSQLSLYDRIKNLSVSEGR